MNSSLSPVLVWWSPVPPAPDRCMCMGHQGRTGERGREGGRKGWKCVVERREEVVKHVCSVMNPYMLNYTQ